MEMRFWQRLRWDIVRQYYQARKALLRLKIGERWHEEEGLGHRRYPDYETYVRHQKTKLGAQRARWIEMHDRQFYAGLTQRLAALPFDLRGRNVLCLAARQGTEVRAFIDHGAFAVGIDLKPLPASRHVLNGDFHELQFADASVDVVFTNSLDHAFDLERILGEVRRVLKPDAHFVVEANVEADEGGAAAGPYESMVWKSADDLLERLEAEGFRLETRSPFDVPWQGEQLVLRVPHTAGA